MSMIKAAMDGLKGARVEAFHEEAHDNSHSVIATLEWSEHSKEYRVGNTFFGVDDIYHVKVVRESKIYPRQPIAQIELLGYTIRLWDIEPPEFPVYYDAQGREHGEY